MKNISLSKIILPIIALLFFHITLKSQSGFDNYHYRNDFLMASPGAMKFGLYGHDNPAILNYVKQPDIMFAWSDQFGGFTDFNRWGLFLGMPNMGFSVFNHTIAGMRLTDYRISSAIGTKSFGFGASYNWSRGDTDFFQRKNSVTLGTLIRPGRYFSLGITGTSVANFNHYEGVFDLAIRPMGNEKIAVFGDYALRNDMKLADGYWSAGVAVEALPGIRVTGRYFDNNFYTFGIEFSLGRVGISTQGGFNKDFKHSHNTYAVRVGAYDRNIADDLIREPKYYSNIDLSKPMRYQKFQLFDKANSLIEILDAIDAAAEDPRISGIAINATSMNINHTMLWELRQQLLKFRETGKKVVIFTDNASMNIYHFISVADKIILDPQGLIILPGYLAGNIYLNKTLAKLGIGVNEWRFYEYKSAFEMLARESMSDEDREQRQRIIDHRYDFVKKDIMASRGFSEEEYERLINELVFFTAKDALEHKLVDELGRWSEVNDILKEFEGKEKKLIGKDSLQRYQLPADNYWGEKPKIAVIYAVGPCAMETGIRAKSLSKDIAKARKKSDIKAIVFRVESPGGSPLASDVVAAELLKAKEEKPVIITQGSVAASGGYWLSMYGDTIIAAPNTLTGSIGVITGWFYDQGIKDKTGYETDLVKRGELADMGFGLVVPLLNMPIMDRKFTEKEEDIIKNVMTSLYDDFVEKVANARGQDFEDIDAIARGRVWTGYDALKIGLVDTLGGLQTAINIALEKSGIGIGEEYQIVEYPKPGLFDFSGLLSGLIGTKTHEIKEDPLIKHLKFRLKHNTEPMLILPLEYMNFYFNENKGLD